MENHPLVNSSEVTTLENDVFVVTEFQEVCRFVVHRQGGFVTSVSGLTGFEHPPGKF